MAQTRYISTALVVWGSLKTFGSTAGGRWTSIPGGFFLDYNSVPSNIIGIFVGLLLSNGNLQLRKGRVNALFYFTQSLRNFPYLWFIYNLLSHFLSFLPISEADPLLGIGYCLFGRFILYTLFTFSYYLMSKDVYTLRTVLKLFRILSMIY